MTRSRGPETFEVDLRLRVPAEPASLATVRAFAASAGDALGLGPDAVEDLKLILNELCAGAEPPHMFEVALSEAADGVAVDCVGDQGASGPVADRRRGILEALIPEAVLQGGTLSFFLAR